jgi:hypothetical protein
MTARTQAARTGTNNAPPGVLLPGQFYLEMGAPLRLWAGVPVAIDGTGRRLLLDAGTSTGGPYLSLSGGVMTGPLILSGSPTDPKGAVTKAYADSVAPAGGPYLKLSGGALTGPLSVAGALSSTGGMTTVGTVQVNASTAGSGGVHLQSADTAHPGIVGFNAPNGARVGYVGYGDGVNKLMLQAEAPYTGWRVGGTLDVNGTITASVGLNVGNIATINGSAGQNALLSLNAGTSQVKLIQAHTNGAVRWQVQVSDGNPETGGNNGSNFSLHRFGDAGDYLGQAFSINRATGDVNVAQSLGAGVNIVAGSAFALTRGAYILQTADGGYTQFVQDALAWRWQYTRANGTMSWIRGSDNLELMNITGAGDINVIRNVSAGGTVIGGVVRSTGAVYADNGQFIVANNPAYRFERGGNGNWAIFEGNTPIFIVGPDGTTYARGQFTSEGTVRALPGDNSFAANANGYYITLCGGYQFETGANWIVNGGGRPNTIVEGYWTTNRVFAVDTSGTITINGQAYKPGGGAWGDTSDARIKTVHGDYTKGLAEALRLRPVVYSYNGNDSFYLPGETTHTDTEKHYVGFVAQEVQGVLPAMVTEREGWIETRRVKDLLILDTSALPCVLLNAIKELHARVAALETKH